MTIITVNCTDQTLTVTSMPQTGDNNDHKIRIKQTRETK